MENQTDTNEWHWWTSRIFLEVARVQAPFRTAPPSVTAWGRGLCRTCAALTWAGGVIRGLHTASVEAPWPPEGGGGPHSLLPWFRGFSKYSDPFVFPHKP